jgi:hypothetical protein
MNMTHKTLLKKNDPLNNSAVTENLKTISSNNIKKIYTNIQLINMTHKKRKKV